MLAGQSVERRTLMGVASVMWTSVPSFPVHCMYDSVVDALVQSDKTREGKGSERVERHVNECVTDSNRFDGDNILYCRTCFTTIFFFFSQLVCVYCSSSFFSDRAKRCGAPVVHTTAVSLSPSDGATPKNEPVHNIHRASDEPYEHFPFFHTLYSMFVFRSCVAARRALIGMFHWRQQRRTQANRCETWIRYQK